MPWNVTASLQGSAAGSSSVSRTLENYDLSSRRFHSGMGRRGSRLPSASPLAGRSLPRDLFGNGSLSSLSLEDFGQLHDDRMKDIIDDGGSDTYVGPYSPSGDDCSGAKSILSGLHKTDRNFLDFLQTHAEGVKVAQESMGYPHSQKIVFSILLPPKITSRAVATQALMHVLLLATKDVIHVSQKKRCQGPPYLIADLDEIRFNVVRNTDQVASA